MSSGLAVDSYGLNFEATSRREQQNALTEAAVALTITYFPNHTEIQTIRQPHLLSRLNRGAPSTLVDRAE